MIDTTRTEKNRDRWMVIAGIVRQRTDVASAQLKGVKDVADAMGDLLIPQSAYELRVQMALDQQSQDDEDVLATLEQALKVGQVSAPAVGVGAQSVA